MDFTCEVDWPQRQRMNAVEAIDEIWGKRYGGPHRQEAYYFREDPLYPCPKRGCYVNSAPSVGLRSLADVFRRDGTGPVKVELSGFDKSSAAEFSGLLERVAVVAENRTDDQLAAGIRDLGHEFGRQCRVPDNPAERARLAAQPAAVREAKAAKDRALRDHESRTRTVRALEGA